MNNQLSFHKKNGSVLTLFKSIFFTLSFILLLGGISSCIKEPKQIKDENQYGTLWINNRSYLIVQIEEQWWMAENLVTSTYNNGQTIPVITTANEKQWATTKSGAKDGQDYNWYALVNDSLSLLPPGWHLPSDEEWKILEKNLGMDDSDANKLGWRGNNEGDKLKSANNLNWPKYDQNTVWGTNESGFDARAFNCRMFYGNQGEDGNAFFWTATDGPSDTTAYYRCLDYKKSSIFRQYGSKNYGFQVRLVKDN